MPGMAAGRSGLPQKPAGIVRIVGNRFGLDIIIAAVTAGGAMPPHRR